MKNKTRVQKSFKTDEKQSGSTVEIVEDNSLEKDVKESITDSTVEIEDDLNNSLERDASIDYILEIEDDLNNSLEEEILKEAIIESVTEEINEVFIEQKLSEDVEDKTYQGDFKDELSTICEEDLEESVKEDVEQVVLINAEKIKADKSPDELGKNKCIGFFTPISIDLNNCVGCEYESNCYSRKKAKEKMGMSVEISDGKELKVAPEKCFENNNKEDFEDIDDYYEDEDMEEFDKIDKLVPKLAKIEKIVKENQKQIKVGVCITGVILGTLTLIKLFRKD